jgi:hypothetical protein
VCCALWAAFDKTIAVGHIDQHVTLTVEETNNLQRLENQADLAARDAGVAGVLGHPKGALHSSRLRSGDVAGDTLDFGIVEIVDHDLVIRPK